MTSLAPHMEAFLREHLVRPAPVSSQNLIQTDRHVINVLC